ncbi:hypothetical protein C0995_002565 [Termitomyces sp. Mi166|nr:hypothetical protein C0995_002565 [Termitomyces sp. Mi166\
MPPVHGPIGAKVGDLSPMDDVTSDIVCEGWVLKKRRKKMQGFARRYFTLYESGVLSYSFEPGQPVRDQVTLHHAAITTASGRRDIHIDSGTATFHIKCLSAEDFNMWMVACRKFISLGVEARKSASVRFSTRHGNPSYLVKAGTIVEEMGPTIKSLEISIQTLVLETPSLSKKSYGPGRKSDRDKIKDTTKETRFGFFKRSSNPSSSHPSEFGSDITVLDVVPGPLHPSFHRIQVALDTLKSQHAILVTSMQALAEISQPNQGSPVPATVEEEGPSALHDPYPPLSTPVSRLSKRASIATSGGESMQEWFDALDDAEEFVMDMPTPEEQLSKMLVNESGNSVNQEDASSIDTDIEDLNRKHHAGPTSVPSAPEPVHMKYRKQLPSLPVGDEGSLFAILKKNVGKDLSTITFPVTFNEPLTLLQRAAEEVEYYSVLDDAARADDPFDRMCYVAAFAVSSYTHTRHRTGRKAFNPMLGETFEDPRMKFIAEKVRHNPLEIAYHAEGKNWELNATSSGKTKFWGKSLEIIPLGTTHLTIQKDHYVWNKPSSFMRNLMVGTKYLEHTGKMTIENTRDRTRCVLDFKPNGYWGPSNVVTGAVYGPRGDIVIHLEGKWDDQMTQTLDSSNFRILWRSTPFPKNTHEFYGFTFFGITLNELTDDLLEKIPPTDSRLRPDVRALEEGDIDRAEEQKLIVEEMQRERRRQGKDCHPRWFQQRGDSEWVYAGGYWEARERGWKGEVIQSLW